MTEAIPVVVCGQHAHLAEGVKVALQPEYEVIHAFLSFETAKAGIPSLLRGEDPSPGKPDVVGTKNYARPAEAIILGGPSYTEEMASEMREACKGMKEVPWLRIDLSKPTPPVGPAYGTAVVERVRVCLGELVKGGKMGADGVYLF